MIFSTQYYRPPFPVREHWDADLAQIRATGFDAIYLTAPWSWIEPQLQHYVFDDFDALIERAGRAGLKVIVNLWGEMQPLWIHRVLPDANMIDHMGRPVISSQLAYMHFGLTPGACTDHPDVRDKLSGFLRQVAARYANSPDVLQWDCWNEMRWMSQADGFVCFCRHTVERFHRWLAQRYGTLEQLNAAWQRRYTAWSDVQPAKLPPRTYLDAIIWQEFLSCRTEQDLRWRYEQVRAADPHRPIIAHASFPSIFCTGEYIEFEPALVRGNDWNLAAAVDGYGGSHFPAWFHPSPADLGARIEAVRCAAAGKPYWLAELQGGAAGHGLQAMRPVPGATQARWVWNGIARGAKAANFWCWRDEVFGRESGGFGIVGDDGYREDRLMHLHETASLLRRKAPLLDAYQPAPARAAVIFEPAALRLDWASYTQTGLAPPKDVPYPAGHSLQGYLRALERLQIPYDVVETGRASDLQGYRLLVLPWALTIHPDFAEKLLRWVQAGGTLLVEAGLDAFSNLGFYRYPAERTFAKALGLQSEGRRQITEPQIDFAMDGMTGRLRAARWVEPWSIAGCEDLVPGSKTKMMVRGKVGQGTVIAIGSFVGLGYWEERYADFERLLRSIACAAQAMPDLECDSQDGEVLQWRLGRSGDAVLLFILNEGAQVVTKWQAQPFLLRGMQRAEDWVTGRQIRVVHSGTVSSFDFTIATGGYHVLQFERDAT